MLITYHNETSGTTLRGNEPPSRSLLREGASRNPAIQLRAVALRSPTPVASSRGEEMTTHPFIQFLRDIAPVLAVALFAIALGVVAAVIKALVFG